MFDTEKNNTSALEELSTLKVRVTSMKEPLLKKMIKKIPLTEKENGYIEALEDFEKVIDKTLETLRQ